MTAVPPFVFLEVIMCKWIKNYFSMVIDNKESVVVIPREYTGSPMLAYSPDVLITTEYIFNKYRDSIMCDLSNTRIVFLN